MEKIEFPVVIKGRMKVVKVLLERGNIGVETIEKALGESASGELGLRLASIDNVMHRTLTIDLLDAWLRSIPGESPLLNQMRANLAATIRSQSMDLVALEAEAAVRRAADNAVGAALIGEDLTGEDYFRKDASIGFDRMMPDVIDYTANSGSIDLFVQTRPEDYWGTIVPSQTQRVNIPINDGYPEHLISDMRRANLAVLTGPQAAVKAPEILTQVRGQVAARRGVRLVDGKPESVMIPKHPEIFSWEMAVIKGAKDANDVELPGSPYHRIRPLWIDE